MVIIMLKNTSVRTIIILITLLSITIINIVLLFNHKHPLIIINTLSIIALIATWCYLTKYLVNPIEKVKRGMKDISSGNLSLTIPEFGNNCAGKLIPGINELSNEIKELVIKIKKSCELVQVASNKNIMQSEKLSINSEKQSSMIIQTAANMEQISAGTKNNASSTRELYRVTQGAYTSSLQIENMVNELTKKMNSINSRSEKMNEIISVIDNISFQTNILSLNAAVEAARAGEHGKGFAVVASEVRILSHKTSESAKKIKKLIEETNNELDFLSKKTLEIEESMHTIVSNSEGIESFMNEVKISNEEQRKGTEEINGTLRKMENLNDLNVEIVAELSTLSKKLENSVSILIGEINVFSVSENKKIGKDKNLEKEITCITTSMSIST